RLSVLRPGDLRTGDRTRSEGAEEGARPSLRASGLHAGGGPLRVPCLARNAGAEPRAVPLRSLPGPGQEPLRLPGVGPGAGLRSNAATLFHAPSDPGWTDSARRPFFKASIRSPRRCASHALP